MFGNFSKTHSDASSLLTAIYDSVAVFECDKNGRIEKANDIFCSVLGCTKSEVLSKDHKEFHKNSEVSTQQYKEHWETVLSGQSVNLEKSFAGKNGEEIWLNVSLLPILNKSGDCTKVVAIASDISEQKHASQEALTKLDALSKSTAIIEFEGTGIILNANENFCGAVGYDLNEIVGQHHSMFVDKEYADSAEYKTFWADLRQGKANAGLYRRFGKNNKEIYIQASYNPQYNSDGEVEKVVKFATDITSRINSLNKIGACLNQLAEGDLSSTLDDNDFDESYIQLRDDLNTAIDRFGGAFGKIRQTADGVTTGIRSIVSSSDDLSQRTEKQAASLEEAASSLSKITETVRHSSEGAENTRKIVDAANRDAQTSSEVVEKALSAMSEIEESAQEINQIISVIDEIAFQTNLLALNAGVEAARAGDAGQGFAVVASEVRALAQRAAVAAKEIKGLISKSSEQVAGGSKLVTEAGEFLRSIANQVVEISSVVGEIADGAKDQFQSLDEINKSVADLEQGTQQNAAIAEESTAAAHSLQNESSELIQQMMRFKLDQNIAQMQTFEKENEAPAASPAAELISKVNNAFSGGTDGNAALSHDEWEEF